MKKTIKITALAFVFSFAAISCQKSVSDAELTTQSTTAISAYPETSVEVKDGVAHLSGTFASQGDKDAAIAAIKNIKGVRDVMDMASVEAADPVMETITAIDQETQQKVADAIKDFPSVKMDVVNGELTLTGEVTAEQARKIKMSVDALKVGKVNYNYNVKK